jgi:hypothetical protein
MGFKSVEKFPKSESIPKIKESFSGLNSKSGAPKPFLKTAGPRLGHNWGLIYFFAETVGLSGPDGIGIFSGVGDGPGGFATI